MHSIIPTMLDLILFSILIGALLLVLLRLERIKRTDPVSQQIYEKIQKEAETKRINDMIKQLEMETEKTQTMEKKRRTYLESKENLTPTEWTEREEMRAVEIHNKEMEAIKKGDIPYNHPISIFSANLKKRDDAMRAASMFADMPSALGLNIKEKNPSTKRWNLEMEVRARASIGSIFEWMSCGVLGDREQIVSYVLIRVNDTHRWHQLIVTREKSETLEEVIIEYVNKLNINLFHGNLPTIKIIPSVDVPAGWVLWNPDINGWDVRQ